MREKAPKTSEKIEKQAAEPKGPPKQKNTLVLLLVPALVLMGGLSFGVSFLLFKPEPAPIIASPPPDPGASPAKMGELPGDREAWVEKVADTEVNFDELTRQQNARTVSLDQREAQLRTQETRLAEEAARLKQEIAALESVQMQTLEALRKVHEARAALEENRVVITREERANLKLLVAKYDKMSTAEAGAIFQSMCASGREDVVVRILYTMKERSAAKILAEMDNKSTSARLTELLLRVRDQQNV